MTNRKPRVLKGYLMPFETLKQAEEYVETNTDLSRTRITHSS